ncbi:hypothetical protein RvY_13720 [Ramazzottius varieornatus]|uniref:VWFC domain-containing protein n=1 Tax=Ramazzottius varieornatus TaxID=947166 RepID=A0A1D1VNV4_RAMVA|nr:hypothetical protein RvY_13720 [Ramazzottius varieornatus]
MIFSVSFFTLLALFACIQALPVSKGIQPGTPCNDVEEIVSKDPCQPLCSCLEGKIFCAELYCSREGLPTDQQCHKVQSSSDRCCPTYLCLNDKGTAEMHYPLPNLFLPPELDRDLRSNPEDIKEKSPEKVSYILKSLI